MNDPVLLLDSTVLVAARATSAVVLTYDPDRYTGHRIDVVDLRP